MTTTPIELAEVVGYCLCAWPPPDQPFNVPHKLEVYETVEEARAVRDHVNRDQMRVAVVQVRRVVVK